MTGLQGNLLFCLWNLCSPALAPANPPMGGFWKPLSLLPIPSLSRGHRQQANHLKGKFHQCPGRGAPAWPILGLFLSQPGLPLQADDASPQWEKQNRSKVASLSLITHHPEALSVETEKMFYAPLACLLLPSSSTPRPIRGVTVPLLLLYIYFCFLGPHPWHMEVPRLEVQSELQQPTYTTATATPDPSRVCNLHHNSQQHRVLDPLSEARD